MSHKKKRIIIDAAATGAGTGTDKLVKKKATKKKAKKKKAKK